jgi:hypothetical protein
MENGFGKAKLGGA